MNRRRLLGQLSTLCGVGIAGCTGIPGLADDFDVGMTPNAFEPHDITVEVGDTVVWLNNGSRAHTVTAYELSLPASAAFFASGGYETEDIAREAWNQREGGNIVTGQRYTHTFDTPGQYPYFCVPHESHGMVGTVVVEE